MSDSWHKNLKNKNSEEIISLERELFLQKNFINVNIKDAGVVAGVSRVTQLYIIFFHILNANN